MPVQPSPDGQLSFEGGQDASLPPSRLPENKIAAGVNITTEKGIIGPRWGQIRKGLTFPKGGYPYKFNKVTNFDTIFYTGKFQAQVPYQVGNNYYQVIVISGVIFLVNQDTLVVQVLTSNTDTQLDENASRIHWTDAGRYLLLFDFPSFPIIIEGQVARRSDPNKEEMPVANLGVYNDSRVFFSNAGNEFSAGDPIGNELTPNAPITVTEIVLEGSDFLQIYIKLHLSLMHLLQLLLDFNGLTLLLV